MRFCCRVPKLISDQRKVASGWEECVQMTSAELGRVSVSVLYSVVSLLWWLGEGWGEDQNFGREGEGRRPQFWAWGSVHDGHSGCTPFPSVAHLSTGKHCVMTSHFIMIFITIFVYSGLLCKNYRWESFYSIYLAFQLKLLSRDWFCSEQVVDKKKKKIVVTLTHNPDTNIFTTVAATCNKPQICFTIDTTLLSQRLLRTVRQTCPYEASKNKIPRNGLIILGKVNTELYGNVPQVLADSVYIMGSKV